MKPKRYRPQQFGPQQISLSSDEGDIFWDLPPYITYLPGAPIGTEIYVVNPSTEDREYAMIARLTDPNGALILEEAVVVYKYAWFTVTAGNYVKLHAELAYETSNSILTVALIEKSTDTEVDTVFTYLVQPTAAQLPPGFPGAGVAPGGGLVIAGTDWSQFLMMMMFIPLIGVMMGAVKEKEEEKEPRLLPQGRG
jgi:hypothetical protein